MVLVQEPAADTSTARPGALARLAREFRLAPVAASAWVAAGVAVSAPDTAVPVAVGLWAGTLAVLAAGWAWHRPRVVLALAGIALAAAALTASQVAVQQPARQAAASLGVGGGRAVVVTATVVGKADRTASGDVMFDARAHRVMIGQAVHAVDVPVSIRGNARPDVGDTVRVRGTAVPTLPGRRAVLVVRAQEVTVTGPAGGVLAVAAYMRHALADATKGLPQPGAGLIPGLAVGDTDGVIADLDTAMKSSSLSHLTAVSGANCNRPDECSGRRRGADRECDVS